MDIAGARRELNLLACDEVENVEAAVGVVRG